MFAVGEASLDSIARQMHARVWVVDRALVLERLIGRGALRGSPLQTHAGFALDVVFAGDANLEAMLEAHRRALDGHLATFEYEDGGAFRTLVQPRHDASGDITGAVAIALNGERRREVLDSLARSEATLALAQTAAHVGHWTCDLATGVTTWSDELVALCGECRDRFQPNRDSLVSFVQREDRLALEAAFDVAREERRPFAVDTQLLARDGVLRWVQHRGKYEYDGTRAVRAIGTVLDITSRKRAEAEQARLAWFDEVTNLPNRPSLVERLAHAIALAGDDGSRIAALLVGLDRFKRVNESLGHTAGDELLHAAGERLVASAGCDAIVGRVGGDEFGIVCYGLESGIDVARFADRIVASFERPIAIAGEDVYVSASVGVGVFPDDAATAETLLDHAGVALSEAKRVGPGARRFYSASAQGPALERIGLERDLRQAFEREAFSLEYQPIVDREERIVAMEALLRFDHPIGSRIEPERFIPLCEEIGIIVPLGRWVVRESLAQLAAWRRDGVAACRMAVNVSARQVLDPGLMASLAEALDESGCAPSDLELEITESFVIADVPSARRLVRDLKRLGVRVSLDDFGTGYSALSYLKHFDVDALKIDRAFVRDLPVDRGDAAIVTAIVALGHAMGLTVVAEGVERQEQAAFVRRLGVDEMQGFYFGRPLPAREMEGLLRG